MKKIAAEMRAQGAALIYQSPYAEHIRRGIRYSRATAVAVPAVLAWLSGDFVAADASLVGAAAVAALLPFGVTHFMSRRLPTMVFLQARSRVPGAAKGLGEPEFIVYRINPWALRQPAMRALNVRARDIVVHPHRRLAWAAWQDRRSGARLAVPLEKLEGSVPDLSRWIRAPASVREEDLSFREAFMSRLAALSGFGAASGSRLAPPVSSPSSTTLPSKDADEFSRLA